MLNHNQKAYISSAKFWLVMQKIHAKQKRYHRSATHLRSPRPASRIRTKRSKSFATQEAAVQYAEKMGLKKFEISKGQFSKKFWIKA